MCAQYIWGLYASHYCAARVHPRHSGTGGRSSTADASSIIAFKRGVKVGTYVGVAHVVRGDVVWSGAVRQSRSFKGRSLVLLTSLCLMLHFSLSLFLFPFVHGS